jgi:hypothetical protein
MIEKRDTIRRLLQLSWVLLLLIFGHGLFTSAQAQPKTDSTAAAKKQVKTNLDEGVLIDLGEVQIRGEIAQPNVLVSHSRQKPMFREISLRRTPTEGLTNLDITAQDSKSSAAARIKNWNEMLERPRE